MRLDELNIGDKIQIQGELTSQCECEVKYKWYNAEVVDLGIDKFGPYIKILVFPTSVWSEDPMLVRSTEKLKWRS